MKKQDRPTVDPKSILLLCFLLSALLFSSPAPAAEPLTIASSHWPPFASTIPGQPGFFNEVVTEAFAISGMEVRYIELPWARCFQQIKSGRTFGGIPFTKTAEREEFALFSDALFMTRNPVVFNKRLNPAYDYQGQESLKNYRLLALLGWSYLEAWKKAGIKYKTVKNQDSAFKMINLDRAELTVFDEFAAKEYFRKHPEMGKNIGLSRTPYSNNKMHLMVSRKYPEAHELVDTFNTNLRQLKSTGFLDRLAQKYGFPLELVLPQEK
ncbi:ABC transporter substrate-binding protein [Desulfovibrio sp. JC022]|uniref:substrate-binding periplasmic protein n=1 Tax=Desulfovibrio sp. JC022 TaxID=2593642 RepID=UPI0013D2641B|nr:transporter substrate-binding domain-containing protein [Desulfovibrio sp. JC022]NDV24950.1 amino acid ABC transporter substrate-binding protein [Desulfovibrio sp. JC022]